MLIFDLLKENKSKRKFYRDKNEAFEYFSQQRKALKAIEDTKWFKTIKEFFMLEVSACNERLRTMKSKKDMFRVQWELDISMKFLDFLDNVLSDVDKEDLDILNS
jgi:hypothetical protein